jgi:hypothetical protein
VSVVDLARRSRPPEGLPCCTLVALALLEGEGNEIRSIDDGVRVGGLDWWGRANVWSGDAPWSALDAARELTGGTDARILLVRDVAPPLRPGRWHVVQRWRHLGDGGKPGVEDDTVVPGKSTGLPRHLGNVGGRRRPLGLRGRRGLPTDRVDVGGVMLQTRIIVAIVGALSAVAAATRKDSDGGVRITPAERDEILAAVIEAILGVLDKRVAK